MSLPKSIITLITGLLALTITSAASAKHHYIQYRTIYSPGCDAIKITHIGGPAVLSLAARLTHAGTLRGYTIMLDTTQLSFRELFLMMGENGCFRLPQHKHKSPRIR